MHSFAFDEIYWQGIGPRGFGPTQNIEGIWKEQLGILDEKERDKMELPVARKVLEMKTGALSWDPDEYTLAFLEKLKGQEKARTEDNLIENKDRKPAHDGIESTL
ncbi:Aminoglycoside phosphotransferase [Penicillium coprophilum]|uniref:Aminoglycoside phosphotransferase n=1 Tax=Penicillium coprophilum TaxID=36646 RepID=UPI0023852D83|nr:Aminoglycoside phosphotransferase [Penicillium coprophilum]KAJ5150531.1 Aminoglycoside phosphotransferase [Penicillium coprophilum]